MATNKKKLLLPTSLSKSGWAIAEQREDIEAVPYAADMPTAGFHALLADMDGVALSFTPYRQPELDASPRMQVVARIGVGYDAVDIPALTRRGVPLMVAGTANSVSVAEKALFLMMTLAKKGATMHALVREGRWTQRYEHLPADLYGKTVLVVGFGRIGTRIAARCAAMEMSVVVFDPYVAADAIVGKGYARAESLDAVLPKADFVTVHCPKSPETIGLIGEAQLARMKPTAYIVNTARGGIIAEEPLYHALSSGRIAGAGLDVFDVEPAPATHPLLSLDNVISSPHMAGVTREAMDRMGVATVQNLLSVLDGHPNRENVINKELLK